LKHSRCETEGKQIPMRKGDLTQRKPTGEIIMTYNLPITMSLITMQAMGMKVVVIVLLSD
jgi:hypothetical protein